MKRLFLNINNRMKKEISIVLDMFAVLLWSQKLYPYLKRVLRMLKKSKETCQLILAKIVPKSNKFPNIFHLTKINFKWGKLLISTWCSNTIKFFNYFFWKYKNQRNFGWTALRGTEPKSQYLTLFAGIKNTNFILNKKRKISTLKAIRNTSVHTKKNTCIIYGQKGY